MLNNYKEITQAGFSSEIALVCQKLKATLDVVVDSYNLVGDMNDHIFYYEIWTDAELQEVQNVVAKYFTSEADVTPGYYFRSSVKAVSLFDRPGVAYAVIDTWSQNV